MIKIGDLVTVWPLNCKAPIAGIVMRAEPEGDGWYKVHTPSNGLQSVFRKEVFIGNEQPVQQEDPATRLAASMAQEIADEIDNQILEDLERIMG